jgi:ubiquinone/menaquinone biosynthesis C-methylase UbiE
MPSDSVSFDRAVEYYDQTRGFPPGVETEVAKAFVQAGNLTKSSRVLEIGVGTGRIALPLVQHVGAYFGLDLSAAMLGKLKSKQNDKPIYIAQGDATQIPFAYGTFDVVIAVHIFHLIPAWRDALAEVARVLKPTGVLMHGGGQRITENQLDEVWFTAIKREGERRGPFPRGEDEQFLENAGWSVAGEDVAYQYVDQKSPQQYLDSIRSRMWSHCWSMSDSEIEVGYQAVLTYVQEHFPDPTQLNPLEQSFRVRVHRPPLS